MAVVVSDRAPDTLGTYARVRRPRPVTGLVNVLEALFSLFGVIVVILSIYAGSVAGAGSIIDSTLSQGWQKLQALTADVTKGG